MSMDSEYFTGTGKIYQWLTTEEFDSSSNSDHFTSIDP